MQLHEKTKNFILQFLTGYEDENVFKRFRIGYTADRELFPRYDLVFVPSGFFEADTYGTEASLPVGELPEIEGVPFLYGENRVEKEGNTVVVYADLVATAFFFLSRYEEICRPQVRDIHGRFPGRESLLFKNGLIDRPILDEYTLLVQRWLRVAGIELPPLPEKIAKVWLTHDVDAPYFGQSLRAFCREVSQGTSWRTAWRLWRQKREDDPYYTFPRMAEFDRACREKAAFPVQTVYFLKGGGESPYDKPVYRLKSKGLSRLIEFLANQNVSFGLHGSYSSGAKRAALSEKREVDQAVGKRVFFFRNHFLRSCEPSHLASLENIGITDDFTMGYADVAGFRLATTRPVVWINPATGRLSRLVLHPLTVMDATLADPRYMALDEEKAIEYCTSLFQTVRRHGGEVCLLWHNTSFVQSAYPVNPVPWLRDVYRYLLDYLCRLS